MYNHLKKFQTSFDILKKLTELWPIIIIWPTILGYLAFNIYTSKHGITYPDVEIHLIIGLGFFNLFAIALTYYSGLTISRYRSLNSVRITFYIYYLTFEPLIILFTLFLEIAFKAFSNLKFSREKEKKPSFYRLRKIASKQYIYESISDVTVLLFIFSLTFFIDSNVIVVWSFFYFSLEIINYIRTDFKKHIYYLMLITLLTPFVTTLYVLDNTSHTFFGISNQIVEVKLEDELLKGQLNYQSTEFIFLSNDSTSVKIPLSKVLNITQLNEYKKPQSYYHKWFSEK